MNLDAKNLESWNNLVGQFCEAYYYNELLYASRSVRDVEAVGKNIQERNLDIEKRYHPLFTLIEASLHYSLVLSVCHFFDLPKKRRGGELKSIPFFINKHIIDLYWAFTL